MRQTVVRNRFVEPTAPDTGSAHVDRLDVHTTPTDALARRLAVLRQDNHMRARLMVRDLVAFGRYPHSRGRSNSQDKANGTGPRLSRSRRPLAPLPRRAFGGQRQRAFVAMVLAQDTDTVLLDEPLNNLDMRHAVSMMRLWRDAARNMGKAVVMVLHDIDFAAWHADHIVAMRGGTVCRQGSPAAIIEEAALAEICDMPIAVGLVDGRRVCLFYE